MGGGIVFKFCVNNRGMYASDEAAMRVGTQELLGNAAVAPLHEHGLHVPLMCVIDYRGYRLLAVAQLPINSVPSSQDLMYTSIDFLKLFSLL